MAATNVVRRQTRDVHARDKHAGPSLELNSPFLRPSTFFRGCAAPQRRDLAGRSSAGDHPAHHPLINVAFRKTTSLE